MSRHLVWLCVELTKDDPDERGKNRDLVDEVLEEEIDNVSVDVDGVLYNVSTIGRARTKEACRQNITDRLLATQRAKAFMEDAT